MEQKKNTADPYHDPHGVFTRLDTTPYKNKYLDIPYDILSEDQKLDIYLPENRKETELLPVVVYVHGGGFEMGDRKYGHIHKLIEALEKGYACASISYRLSQESVFPAAVQDVRNAIRFLRLHGEEYGIDEKRIGVFGESAGGNLVSLLAMDPQEPIFEEHIPEELAGVSASVAACVDWFGVVDMSVMYSQGESMPPWPLDRCPESRYLGVSLLEADPEWIAKTNPISYISPRMCPMLIEHGTGDGNVPVKQSQMLYHAIADQLGQERVELLMLEGASHEDPRFERDENMALVWAFFDKNL
ncbi:MAG: alpha/beta hydrolase [Clostridiales bacterium]|nr:alpha/beta hydrolase [Clostridiales bacterium]